MLFQISAFTARTKSIKMMVWRSKHNQPLKRNSQESEIIPTLPTMWSESNETVTHLFQDCPHPESLRVRSHATQQLFEQAEIDAGKWEEIVTTEADPTLPAVLEKVIHDFTHRFLNQSDMTTIQKLLTYSTVSMKRKTSFPRGCHIWVKSVKLALLVRDFFMFCLTFS
jgi:hypothetical protein